MCIPNPNTQRVTYARSSRGGRVKSVYMFVSVYAFSSMAPLIERRAAWSGDAVRQRLPMWCAILLSHSPSLIPASRPCLYVTAVVPAISHSTGTLCCVCVFIQEFVCTYVLLPWHIYWNPGLCLHWWCWWRWRGRKQGPLKDSPPSLLSSLLQHPIPQPCWHLPWDKLNELKEIQWDTWCSSQGTPLLLCNSNPLCLPAQAQRRAHLGQSKGSKNTQYVTVYRLIIFPQHNIWLFDYTPCCHIWLTRLKKLHIEEGSERSFVIF